MANELRQHWGLPYIHREGQLRNQWRGVDDSALCRNLAERLRKEMQKKDRNLSVHSQNRAQHSTTLEILGDSKLMESFRRGINDRNEGRIHSMEEVERMVEEASSCNEAKVIS